MDAFGDELWDSLWKDVGGEDDFPNKRPFLAHYTSASVVDAIFSYKKIWLSHPLLMNDFEELQWGINAGMRLLWRDSGIAEACKSEKKFSQLSDLLDQHWNFYEGKSAHSIFVACFSEHDQTDHDGLLSMWRAYGENGGGAAIVFDTSKIKAQDDTPFILAPVKYGTPSQREAWIQADLNKLAEALRRQPEASEENLSIAASYFLEKLKFTALTTKHIGFEEEKEWRLIYLPERDEGGVYSQYVDYVVGPTGFQPKMKLPLTPEIPWMVELSDLVSELILGPAHGSILATTALRSMLLKHGHESLAERIRRSTTPFRPG